MSTDDKMSIDERRKYLRRMKKRYAQATRKERGQLLDEMEAVTELHRKSLIRLMNGDLERKPRRKQRGCKYKSDVDDALRVITESLDYICAERLTPNLVWTAEHLAAHGEVATTPQLLDQLGQISLKVFYFFNEASVLRSLLLYQCGLLMGIGTLQKQVAMA